ncbi:LOW QUALITY PROTEIN: PI-PLC X domain-containing protein 3-like [Amphiura filiformis]|uniref:LOW QUALITY PROTEIN: PI-PLC X domain-containing protein 3-like n=1 Tax=Amphiura filiformis TaxID=82378 RepID=UPI003B217F02
MADGGDRHDADDVGLKEESIQAKTGDFSNWMSKLPPRLCCEPLKNIAIPGSHDSFSFYLDDTSEVAAGSPDTVRNLVSVFGATAKKIVHNWSVTQSLTFKEQLDHGIRYLDLRMSPRAHTSDLFFVHGLFGNTVESGLREINEWLDAHPKEVVLIDFNHFYDMSAEDHQILVLQIQQIFGDKVCPLMDIDKSALNVLWDNKWQVIVFYCHDDTTIDKTQLWPSNCIQSIWPNTTEAPKMVNRLEAYLTRGRPNDKFYVSQGVLTPTGTTILQRISSNLKDVCAPVAMKNLLFFLKNKSIGPKGINIVIADFVELDDFVSKVLALNPSE